MDRPAVHSWLTDPGSLGTFSITGTALGSRQSDPHTQSWWAKPPGQIARPWAPPFSVCSTRTLGTTLRGSLLTNRALQGLYTGTKRITSTPPAHLQRYQDTMLHIHLPRAARSVHTRERNTTTRAACPARRAKHHALRRSVFRAARAHPRWVGQTQPPPQLAQSRQGLSRYQPAP